MEGAAQIRRVPAATADLGLQLAPGVLSVPPGPLAPDRGSGIDHGMPLTRRRGEPPATALAQQKLRLPAEPQGLGWGPARPRGGGWRRGEPGTPPREVQKGPAAAPPGSTARAPRASADNTRAL